MIKASILEYIRDYALTQPDVYAVCELRKNVTYKEYWTNIRKMASVMMEKGIKAGDHVIIRCTQNIEYMTIFTALQYVGALIIPVEKVIATDRIEEIAKAVDATYLVSNEEAGALTFIDSKLAYKAMADAEEAELPLPKEDDRSMLLFTTGTTGASKGVVMHHKNDVAIAGNVIMGTGMKPGNVEIIPMPLNHSFGIRRYQSDMVNGGTVCLMDGMVFVGTLWKLLDKYHATSMALSPASLSMIFTLSGDRIGEYKDQLDYIQIGSAPLVEADKDHLLSLMPDARLYNFYGSSEAGCACILDFNSEDNKPGCVGRPTINSIAKFIDEDGKEVTDVSEEKPALLAWGGAIVMEGYYNEPELTAATMTEDGYVKTRDMAYLDEKGRCILVGRADDIINYGGSKISPAEVEDTARGYDKLIDCACSSIPDPITGEVPVMLIIAGEGYDEKEFIAYLSESLESYKLPKKCFYTQELPKTFKGTLLRKEVKRMIESLQA